MKYKKNFCFGLFYIANIFLINLSSAQKPKTKSVVISENEFHAMMFSLQKHEFCTKITHLNQEITKSEDEIIYLQKRIQTLTNLNDSKNKRLLELERGQLLGTQEIKRLFDKNETLETKNEVLETENKYLKTENELLKQEIKKLRKNKQFFIDNNYQKKEVPVEEALVNHGVKMQNDDEVAKTIRQKKSNEYSYDNPEPTVKYEK